jgi:hypothetical protein
MPAFDGTRPLAPNLPDPEQLRPPPAPNDTFTGAPRPIEDNRLTSLASALGSFNENLNFFGRNESIAQRSHASATENDAAHAYINTRTPDEFAADAKAGKLPRFLTPQAQMLIGTTQGTYAAQGLSQELQQKVGTGELQWGNGSAQSWLQQRRGDVLQQNGWDDASAQARGFGAAFNSIWGAANKQGINAHVEQMNAEWKDAAVKQIDMSVGEAQQAKLDPAATWQHLDSARRTLVQAGHFQPKELDPMIFDALNRRMGTDPNWVMGVGDAPRVDINSASVNANARTAFDYFTREKGYPPVAAAGIVGGLMTESGVNPNGPAGDPSVPGGSHYVGQWNRDRLQALYAFTGASPSNPPTLRQQLQFVDHELNTSESDARDRLLGARTPQEAAAAFVGYERPRGWQGFDNTDLSAVANWDARSSNAGAVHAAMTGEDRPRLMPSLFSKGDYANQVAQMRQRASAFNVTAEDQRQKQAVTDGVAQILNGPNPEALHNVPSQVTFVNSVTGSQGSVSKPEAVKAAVNARITADNQRIASGQATPDQIADEQLNTFARAGERQEQWSDTLNGAAHGASSVSLTQPAQQAQATGAFQLYATLRAKNPAYLDTLLDGNAKRFFSAAYIQRTLFDKTPIEALQAASAIWATPKSEEESSALAAHREQVASAARSLNWGGWFDPSIKNPQLARDAISDAAWSMVRLNGMTPEDAIKAAAPIVNAHFVNVNGSLVPSLGYLPKESMKPAAERYLKDWATGPAAALHEDPANLSIMPVGTGQFVITHANSGMPLVTGRGMNYVPARDLIETAKTINAEQSADRARAVDEAAARAAGAIPGNVSDALHPGAVERRQRPREFMGDSFTPRLRELETSR